MSARKSSSRFGNIPSSGQIRKQPSMDPRRNIRSLSRKTDPLPDQITEDLKECFDLYDTEKTGTIQMSHVRSILWNFGMWRMTKKEMEQMLRQHDIDPKNPYLEWDEMLLLVSSRWNKNGREEETEQIFSTIDKKEKGSINHADIKQALTRCLDIQVSDRDIQELFNMADVEMGNMSYRDFSQLVKEF